MKIKSAIVGVFQETQVKIYFYVELKGKKR